MSEVGGEIFEEQSAHVSMLLLSQIYLNMAEMSKNNSQQAFKQRQNEPKLIGNVHIRHFHSNSPLAKASRKRLASVEISAEKGGDL